MMKQNVFLLACVWGACLITGCTDNLIVNDDTANSKEGAPFVIYASSEQKAASRLTFDEDGLTMLWENGDQLVLVDVNDKVAPIYLTTELDEPSSTAVFKSESGVPAGTYYIRNYHGTKYDNYEDWMTIDLKKNTINDYKYDRQYQLGDLTASEKQIELCAGPYDINGQTNLEVDLKHTLAMLKFNITGIELPSDKCLAIGMVSTEKLLPTKIWIDKEQKQEKAIHNLQFTPNRYFPTEKLSELGAFILPVDLTGENIRFYVEIYNADFIGNELQETIYVIEKEGINLEAGTCYTVKLDLSSVEGIEIKNKEISTADQFRALSYNAVYANSFPTGYTIQNDIDFEKETLMPILFNGQGSFDGQGHTLSNIKIDWPYDEAGIFSYSRGELTNFTLENVQVNGSNYVGALVGTLGISSVIENCKLIGEENTITGTGDYVGGLFGRTEAYGIEIKTCSVNDGTTVQGKNVVGGIVGFIENNITACESAATVSGENKVGGIVGIAGNYIRKSHSTAQVTATGDCVGGLAGAPERNYFNIEESSFEDGTVSGANYVGGIIGGTPDFYLTIKSCYSTGTVKGKTYVGGISGIRNTIENCYSLSTIEGEDPTTTAGLGMSAEYGVTNSYFAGNLPKGGYGITGNAEVTNCLTTYSNLSDDDTEEDATYTNLESILKQVEYINGDKAYSPTEIWENVKGDCPLLLWQVPSMSVGGEDGEVAPPFEEEEW